LSEVRAVLQVVKPPAVERLYFWALQVCFVEQGRELGTGHTGLQWHPAAPAGAVNWGGYDAATGDVLPGTGSVLPPVDGPHTRRYLWLPGRKYMFRVSSPSAGVWRSEVTDLQEDRTTVVRDLQVGAGSLAKPVVWSEVFADCDDPPSEVRWSGLEVVDASGCLTRVTSARPTYQSVADGGCSNTESYAAGDCFVQATSRLSARRPSPGVISLSL
jgi:hypothetical protein